MCRSRAPTAAKDCGAAQVAQHTPSKARRIHVGNLPRADDLTEQVPHFRRASAPSGGGRRKP